MALSPMMMAYDTGPDPVLSNHDLRPVVLHASMKDSETKMFWPTGEFVNHGLGTLKTKLRLEFIISVVKLRQLSCMKCTRHAQLLAPFLKALPNFLVSFANSIGHPDFNHGEHAPWMIFNHFPNWSGQVSRPLVCIVKYRADWTSRRPNRKSTAPTTRIIASKANAQVTQRPT
ncbi:hypothetical protein Peur_068452 [Populus x canadensis]